MDMNKNTEEDCTQKRIRVERNRGIKEKKQLDFVSSLSTLTAN